MFLNIRKFGFIATTFLAATIWTGTASTADSAMDKSRVLIVYFSHTNTTKEIAERLQKKLGAALYRIEPVKSYPVERQAVLDQGRKETADGVKPALKGEPPGFDDIDLVLIGGPVWYGTLSSPLSSFLAQADLKGKTIAPFCTHGGGIRDYFKRFKDAVSKETTVLEGLGLSRVKDMKDEDIESSIDAWLANLPRPATK